MRTSTQATQGNPTRRTRRAAGRAATSLLVISTLAAGTYVGAQKVAEHYLTQHTTTDISYQSLERLQLMVEHAHHSPATKAGSFVNEARLEHANVRGIRVESALDITR